MCPLLPVDDDPLCEPDEVAERARGAPPRRFHRGGPMQRVRVRARRSRSNEPARRGMHQRRNRRITW
jgi:hypothetical protein